MAMSLLAHVHSVDVALPPKCTKSFSRGSAHKWTNWAGNWFADPEQIFCPRSLNDLITIVNHAATQKKKIRTTGASHSWSSACVVNNDGFLVVTGGLNKIFDPFKIKTGGGGSEGPWAVEVQSGVVLKDLDTFLQRHKPPLAMPSNVGTIFATYGGILSMGCHGASLSTRTISDLVIEMKLVDAKGTLRTFSKEKDPAEFAAAVVNLGLLGIIYSYTIRVEPMFKLLMVDSYPLASEYFADPSIGGPKLRDIVLGNYMTSLIYRPFSGDRLDYSDDRLWLKLWNRTDRALSHALVPQCLQTSLQDGLGSFSTCLGQHIAAHPSLTRPVLHVVHTIMGTSSESVLQAPNAIHFTGGSETLVHLDMGFAFKTDRDFANVVQASKYVIDLMYEYAHQGVFPLNIALNLRFVKSSAMIMSHVYDEDPEAIYCMIELLSFKGTPGFDEFSTTVAQYWMKNFGAR
ncbi:hypothetical protein DFQ26_008024 [Actinomortierella ambigua]|nr:hypothetical protein DFQ26_008024 [Actinomortierella ambigua]